MTIWEALKDDWHIKKREITAMGINPNKEWDEIMLSELNAIADFFEITTAELINNS